MKKYIPLIIILIILNASLFLAFEVNKLFGYLIISILAVVNYFFFFYLNEKISMIASKKDYEQNSLDELTADQHPIIKAAKRRLGQ